MDPNLDVPARIYSILPFLAVVLAGSEMFAGCAGHLPDEDKSKTELTVLLALEVPNLSGLAARYSFNGNANDSVAGRNLSIAAGSPSLTADRYGTPSSAYFFNGASYFTASDSSPVPLPSGNSPRSICLWYNITATTSQTFAQYGTGALAQAFGLSVSATLTQVYTYSYDLNAFLTPRTNTWTHFCGVYSGSEMKAYVNGVAVAQATVNTTTVNTTLSSLTIGRSNFQADFVTGSIDDVRIYNRALSAIDVFAIYSGL